ncbi:MAG: GAF domain-containing protein [Nitrospinota bacterium]|nr:MAG: GAF domain-containing protein [Nitrospinota bacterium]
MITDIMMGAVSGFDVMNHISTHTPETLVIVITGYASTESAIEAIRRGAYDYIAKPFDVEMLEASVKRALEKIQLQREVRRYTAELEERAQALARSEQALRRQTRILQESMGDGLVIVDAQGRISFCNPAAERFLNLETTDLPLEEWPDRSGLYLPDTLTPYPIEEHPLVRAMQGEAVDAAEMFVRHKQVPDGLWLSVTARPLTDDAGRPQGGVAVFRDMTSRKQREQELESLVTVTKALCTASSRTEMEVVILEQLLHLLKAEGAALVMQKPGSGEAVIELAGGKWSCWTGKRLAVGEGISGHVIATGQAYVHHNVYEDPHFTYDGPNGCRAVACVPLVEHNQTIGALWVGRKTPITPDEVHLLTTIGNVAANALHRATLYEQTQQRLQRLNALRNIDMAITASLDLRVTLNVFLDQLTAQLHLDAADILLLDPHTQTLEHATGRGFQSRNSLPSRLRLGEGTAGQAALERRTIFIPDLQIGPDPLLQKIAAQESFVSYYAVPLLAKGQIKGVMEIFHRTLLEPEPEWLNFLEALSAQAAIAIDNATLFDELQRSNLELVLAYDSTLEGWSRALDLRDQETEGHTQRVTDLTIHLARAMGINNGELIHIRRGALLHDIGKMGIPDHILRKPGPLSAEEWKIMRQHPVYAYEMLSPIPYLRPALDIPHYHHEKWDGSGYPRGLKGEDIPFAARIFAVADVWDALRSDRPYRKAWSEEEACTYIRSLSGIHFDPQVVEIFLTAEIWRRCEKRYALKD